MRRARRTRFWQDRRRACAKTRGNKFRGQLNGFEEARLSGM